MTEIVFKSTVTAELLSVDGDETRICQSARVSTARWVRELAEVAVKKDVGLLRSLVRERHGSPFESCEMRWHVEAPIFVAREAVRHRVSNWNEESGRYVELKPIFYLPAPDRPIVQSGKPMAYHLEAGDANQHDLADHDVRFVSNVAWNAYRRLLDAGIAREVARMVLPVNIMTHWIWKMNLRSLTNFLSLRIRDGRSHIESKPQLEIQSLALQMQADFAQVFPTVFTAWDENGRLPL